MSEREHDTEHDVELEKDETPARLSAGDLVVLKYLLDGEMP